MRACLFGLGVLVGCAGGHAEHPPPTAPAPEQADDPYAACISSRCEGAADATVCAKDKCAQEPEQWALMPKQVSYADGVMTVAVRVEHTPMRVGGTAIPRTEEAFVGVTAIREDGEEIDLAIHTLFPGRFTDEPLLVAEVGEGVRDIIFGLWDRKVEPCDSNRSGCRKFGFLLDGSLAAWPPRIYVDSQRQRLPPARLPVQVQWAGGDLASLELLPKAQQSVQQFVEAFGSEVVFESMTLAAEPLEQTMVSHTDSHDAPLASELASAFDGRIEHVETGPLLTLRLGGDKASWTCARTSCDGADDLASCLTEHCR